MKAARRIATTWLLLWFSVAFAYRNFPSAHQLSHALLGIEPGHLFGFDTFGRDVLGTTLRASFVSAAFALSVTLTSLFLALSVGTPLAIAPAFTRFVGLRILDTALAFPSLLFALAWAAIRGPGWGTLVFALLIGIVPSITRLVYLRARDVMKEDFVLAARSLGAGDARIAVRHIMPAVFSLVLVKAPSLFAHALLAEATLTFLGIGAPIGHDSWGSLLAQGKDYLIESPHIAFGAGLPLILTVLSLQLLSETDT